MCPGTMSILINDTAISGKAHQMDIEIPPIAKHITKAPLITPTAPPAMRLFFKSKKALHKSTIISIICAELIGSGGVQRMKLYL